MSRGDAATSAPALLLALGVLVLGTGCSFFALNPAPREALWHLVEPERCTSRYTLPALDTATAAWALLGGFVGLAVIRSPPEAESFEEALTYGVGGALLAGTGFATALIFGGSAAYGYVRVDHCRDYEAHLARYGIDLNPPRWPDGRRIEQPATSP
jgi:hypothetical protein